MTRSAPSVRALLAGAALGLAASSAAAFESEPMTLASLMAAEGGPEIGAAQSRGFCRLALALALDISSSVSAEDYAIQAGGLAAALRAGDVQEALLTQEGEVWLAIYEWSGWQQQNLVADWTPIRSRADADGLAARLEAHRRPYKDFSTAVGQALEFGARLLARAPGCERHVIDISGDGEHNEHVRPSVVRARGLLDGITINALVIEGEWPAPAPFYRDEVISGPGAFMLVARNGFEDYPDLIRGKLLREIRPPTLIGSAE